MGVAFKVPGTVKAKARARTYYDSRAGRYRSVTPSGTVEYENMVRMAWSELNHPGWHDGQALSVMITAHYEIPKSVSRKKRDFMMTGRMFPTKRPDADNIAKAICDALNSLAYHDDSQIVMLTVIKRYVAGSPYALVSIMDLEELNGTTEEVRGKW